MRQTDVAIVGGGLAGSLAAAMLGRAGIDAVLVDPHETYPPELRCEKLDGSQLAILAKTGLAPAVLARSVLDGSAWVARFGRLLDEKPSDQEGIRYDDLVNALRAAIPGSVPFIQAKVAEIATAEDRQTLTLSTGETVSARLVVLASGLNISFRNRLGLERQVIAPCHSITIGFDVAPVGHSAFAFRALTYYPEKVADRIAYLTLFPVASAMRANFMVYRDMNDPWLRTVRRTPKEALLEVMPGLARLMGDFEVTGRVEIRPADLYVTKGCVQPGVVLVGDAFCTSCPAAGTGAGKVFNDVERLCNAHIPGWLATPGMDAAKIAAFYDDPAKRDFDAACYAKAVHLRALSTDTGLAWAARRLARFAAAWLRGRLHALRPAVASRGPGAAGTQAAGKLGARPSG